MSRRNHSFSPEEYYHCYNRGTDKRVIFFDKQDFDYFQKSIEAYNSFEVLGRLRLHKQNVNKETPVTILAYCLLPNHFHFLLRNNLEKGLSKFIQRLSIGYTMYFNQKYKRSGVLFQGPFKSKHIETDQDLKQVLAYVAFNNVIHNIKDENKFRSYLNTDHPLVRVRISNTSETAKLKEVVEIIRDRRLDFDN